MFNFFQRGGNGKWKNVTATEAINKAKNGKATVASYSGSSNPKIQGHIAVVLPKGSAIDIRIAQAGRTSSNDLAFSTGFGSHVSTTKFFTYL